MYLKTYAIRQSFLEDLNRISIDIDSLLFSGLTSKNVDCETWKKTGQKSIE